MLIEPSSHFAYHWVWIKKCMPDLSWVLSPVTLKLKLCQIQVETFLQTSAESQNAFGLDGMLKFIQLLLTRS